MKTSSELKNKNPIQWMHLRSTNISEKDLNVLRIFLWIIAIILMFALICYVHFEITSDFEENDNSNNKRSMNMLRAFTGSPELKIGDTYSGCLKIDCSFVCANSTNLSDDFQKSFRDNDCPRIDVLQIERQNFTILSKYWLPINFSISELLIVNSYLVNIENEAFNTESFTETFILYIRSSKFENLTAGMLLGFSRMEYLTIIGEIKEINRGFFQSVHSTLHYLKLNQMTDKIEFDQIFGYSNMTSLKHLDLSNNNFKTIIGSVFKRLKKLKYLNLSNSKIEFIGKNAFANSTKNLKFLDLSHNRLTKIYNLEHLLERHTYIYLRGNLWNCDCDIMPIIYSYKHYRDFFMDIPYCKYPRDFYGDIIFNVPLNCSQKDNKQNAEGVEKDVTTGRPNYESKTTTTPEEKSTSTANVNDERKILPADNEELFNLTCFISNTVEDSSNSNEDYKYSKLSVDLNENEKKTGGVLIQKMKILSPSYEFNITLVDDHSAILELFDIESDTVLSVIWYSSESDEIEYDCLPFYNNNKVIIENLMENSTYVFCIIPEVDEDISPFNCLPLFVPISPKNLLLFADEEVWLTEDDKQATITIICFIFSISITLGGLVTFLVLKNYPDLLEGSKHVIVVKKSPEDRKSSNEFILSTVCESLKSNGNDEGFWEDKREIFKENDSDSTYETPVDLAENELKYDSDFADFTDFFFLRGKLENNYVDKVHPKRKSESEHIYGKIKPPSFNHIKRSI